MYRTFLLHVPSTLPTYPQSSTHTQCRKLCERRQLELKQVGWSPTHQMPLLPLPPGLSPSPALTSEAVAVDVWVQTHTRLTLVEPMRVNFMSARLGSGALLLCSDTSPEITMKVFFRCDYCLNQETPPHRPPTLFFRQTSAD